MSHHDFWINSLGEFGTPTDQGGCVNVSEAERTYPYLSSDEAVKRAFDAQLYAVINDTTDLNLYRAWEHVSPLQNSVFRFYGHRDAGQAPSLRMTTEYVIAEADLASLEAAAMEMGASSVEHMWDDQYAVWWSVWGMSFMEIADLQARWLERASRESWSVQGVSVI